MRRLAVLALSLAVLAAPCVALGVSATPDPHGLPGQDKLQKLLDGLYSWSLILCLGALVVAALAWAWGSHSHHHQAAVYGRKGLLVAAAAALLIGASPAVVDFFYELGRR
jgi:hypothetical protein